MRKAETKAVVAMMIFGSIGLFVRWIPLTSSETAFYRAVLGSLFLLVVSLLQQTTVSTSDLKRNFRPLLFTGVALGLNWVFLFEAYKHTTLANATISYYMAPVFVMIVAPMVLKEKRTLRKTVCAGLALISLMIMMQSAAQPSVGTGTLTGLLFGLLAAVFYASVMIGNKFFEGVSSRDTTVGQLVVSAIVLAPYVWFQGGTNVFQLDFQSLAFLAILGIVHTGMAYLLYFSALQEADVQTVALISYLDPIAAVVFSFVFLNEPLTGLQLLGGGLVLGGAVLGEMNWNKHKKQLNT